ncbi:MAG TPA: c-type cytochrome [Pseudomonadales bacterium]|nr:c-type cytochrome [Pseudomonadales bacterium]HND14342.1 c-type cytochrome [Pseudomonadales bacterium]
MSTKRQFRVAALGMFIVAGAMSSFAADNGERGIIERIKPVGAVCIEGQPCPVEATPAVAAASEPVAEPAVVESATAGDAVVVEVDVAAAPAEPAAAEATAAAVAASGRSGADVFNASCAVCHASGLAGAPKPGDAAAWGPRLAQGKETVLKHAVNGLNAMPPKGTCAACSEQELQAAIDHMTAGIN